MLSGPALTTTAPAPTRVAPARRRARHRPEALVLAAGLFAAYCGYALPVHRRMGTRGFDLGIFDQVVRAYAHGQAPVSLLKGPGFDELGDHFSPALAVLAPLYRAFPGAATLLVAQAALFALASLPITRLAADRLGRPAGLCVGIGYGLSWGIQQAVGFDFHEIALAVPLLAASVVALAERRAGAAVAWALPLLLVKEDQALVVAAIGGYVWLLGRRRLGAATMAAAVAAGLLTVFVLIPAFNPAHQYTYLAMAGPGGGGSVKVHTVLELLVLTGFVALRSPVALVGLAVLVPRFWAHQPAMWGTRYQYSATLMPLLFVAFVDGLCRLRVPGRVWTRYRPGTLGLRAAPYGVALLGLVVTLHGQPLRDLASPGHWRTGPAVAAARAALAVVPDGASVAATNRLAPQLTGRCQVYLFPQYPSPALRPQWVVTAETPPAWPVSPARYLAARDALAAAGYRLVVRAGGVRVYRAGFL
ncbi:MAG TPA: DUF2079 domain-containing protein [Rugosimonospora sp.]|nr:DUF2079 domain-containing protein [Rugosimonospora sp.]